MPSQAPETAQLSRMRSALEATDVLCAFWHERCLIEKEYAARLAKLANMSVGHDETGGLRASLDTLQAETERQAMKHSQLADQIQNTVEMPTESVYHQQVMHRRYFQVPYVYTADEINVPPSYALKRWEGDEALPMIRARQEVLGMPRGGLRGAHKEDDEDTTGPNKPLPPLPPTYNARWELFSKTCKILELDWTSSLTDMIWTYARCISEVCDHDSKSCEQLRVVLEVFDPQVEALYFAIGFDISSKLASSSDGETAQQSPDDKDNMSVTLPLDEKMGPLVPLRKDFLSSSDNAQLVFTDHTTGISPAIRGVLRCISARLGGVIHIRSRSTTAHIDRPDSQ